MNYVRGLFTNPIIVKIINYIYPYIINNIIKVNKYNSQVTKYYIFFNNNKVGTSETTREIKNNITSSYAWHLILTNIKSNILLIKKYIPLLKNTLQLLNNKTTLIETDIWFNQWLAGLIDGDGYLGVSKQGYTSCEITMSINDEKTLKIIQNKLGGSIKLRSGVKALRWRLTNKKDMINLINKINGNIRNSKRLPQLYKVCNILNIKVINPIPLNINNGWFIGFFDADGTITYSIKNNYPQLTINVTNKYLNDIQPYMDILGGNIYFDKGKNGYFKWCIQSKENILKLYSLFIKSKSYKLHRIHLISEYYKLKDIKAYNPNNELLYKSWIYFNNKWYKGYNISLKK